MRRGQHSARAELPGFRSFSWHESQKFGGNPTSTKVREVPCYLFG